ncbi:MAG: transposase [Methylocella sp.]
MEIILGQARRRWSEDEKRALVAETFVEGQTVNGVARQHNISRSMLFGWRKQYWGLRHFPCKWIIEGGACARAEALHLRDHTSLA